jgi:hypothetical protein
VLAYTINYLFITAVNVGENSIEQRFFNVLFFEKKYNG